MKYRIIYKIVNTEKELRHEEKDARKMFDLVTSEFSPESNTYCLYIDRQFDTEDECRHRIYEIKQKHRNINIFLQCKEKWQ